MASTLEHDTLICLFHHTDRAERTVQELLELGIPQSAITLIGRARQTADIDSGAATLDSIPVPEQDRQRLADGLRNGGSIVAVSADSSLAGEIEEIFKEYSADKIDEKVLAPSELDGMRREPAMDASAYPDTDAEGGLVGVLLVSEPTAVASGSPDLVTVEETLVLLEPTDLVEDTDLVQPPDGSAASSARFDPSAPVDDVRNPMSDRLNDPTQPPLADIPRPVRRSA